MEFLLRFEKRPTAWNNWNISDKFDLLSVNSEFQMA